MLNSARRAQAIVAGAGGAKHTAALRDQAGRRQDHARGAQPVQQRNQRQAARGGPSRSAA